MVDVTSKSASLATLRRWSIVCGPLALFACSSAPDVAPTTYRSPSATPPLSQSYDILGSAGATLSNAANDLSDEGFRTNDPKSSEILSAVYSGPLDDLVDCGEISLPGKTSPQRAAAAQLTFPAFSDQPNWRALRQMRLDARSVTKTRQTATGIKARTDVTYVVTRTVDTISASGSVLGSDREIISFESGGVGRFGNGLTCQPTGRLEANIAGIVTAAASFGGGIDGLTPFDQALPIEEPVDQAIATSPVDSAPIAPPLPQAPETVGTPETLVETSPEIASPAVAATGNCGALSVEDAAVAAPGACGIQRFSDRIGVSSYPGFDVTVAGGDAGLLVGSPLTLEVSLPGGDRHFHVVHLTGDGMVHHAGPKFIGKDSIGERFLYQTGIELEANDKLELVLVMASPVEIFAFERPTSEPVLDFLAIVNERFNPDSRGLATLVIKRPQT